ncbi:FAD-dependent oxidoreductase [Arthrobacter sp. RAF14]|uniref:FAD-dependent oxidoreductase n=1 Tax=Arthrobacter sp. RAF14 TaxID=3233051 RepID=UPI003F9292EB
MRKPRVAVVGTGTIGSQVLWQLAEHGVPVTGYELYSPGHPRGAAGGESRLFRFIELEDLRYLPVVQRAHTLWNQLQEKAGTRLRSLNGALTIVQDDTTASTTARETAELLGRRAQVLDRDEATRKFPKFDLAENEFAVLDKGAGTIYPERAIRAATATAMALGATIRTESCVTEITQHGRQVIVRTQDDETAYDRVVIAAGAWTSTLVPELAPYLAPRRLLSTWFPPKPGQSLAGIVPYIRAAPNYSYGLPTTDGSAMKLGLGFEHHKIIESPDTADLRVTEEDLTAVRNLARDLLPSLDDYPVRINPYFEAYTRSRIEYVGQHPSIDGAIVMAGFSGKGFKTSPALGELGAHLALGADPREETKFITAAEHLPF